MIDRDVFKLLTPEDHCVNFAYTVSALENDAGGTGAEHKDAAVAVLLDVIETMMAVVIDGGEGFEKALRRGIYAPKREDTP
jgi:hypothetical protein